MWTSTGGGRSLDLKFSATFWVSPPLHFYPGEGRNPTRRNRRGWAQASKVSAPNGSPAESSTHLECLYWPKPAKKPETHLVGSDRYRTRWKLECRTNCMSVTSETLRLKHQSSKLWPESSIRPFTFTLRTAGTSLTIVVSDVKKRRVWIYCAQSSLSSFRDEDLRLSSFLTSQYHSFNSVINLQTQRHQKAANPQHTQPLRTSNHSELHFSNKDYLGISDLSMCINMFLALFSFLSRW